MTTEGEVTITLPTADVAQILDGLSARYDAWKATADAFDDDGNFIGMDDCEMQECSGKAEAQKIADEYKRLIETINAQAVAALRG